MGHLKNIFLSKVLRERLSGHFKYPSTQYPLADTVCSQFCHFEKGRNVEIEKGYIFQMMNITINSHHILILYKRLAYLAKRTKVCLA